jgi:hypothetical protein
MCALYKGFAPTKTYNTSRWNGGDIVFAACVGIISLSGGVPLAVNAEVMASSIACPASI